MKLNWQILAKVIKIFEDSPNTDCMAKRQITQGTREVVFSVIQCTV